MAFGWLRYDSGRFQQLRFHRFALWFDPREASHCSYCSVHIGYIETQLHEGVVFEQFGFPLFSVAVETFRYRQFNWFSFPDPLKE